MRGASVNDIFITSDIICRIIEAQNLVAINPSASAHYMGPIHGRAIVVVVVVVVVKGREVWAYKCPNPRQQVLLELWNEVLTFLSALPMTGIACPDLKCGIACISL
jgi:hypothetical protein